MLAGIHALVAKRARAELDDTVLRQHFDRDPERYRQHEAVDLQALFIPYRKEKDGAGRPAVTLQEREKLLGVGMTLAGQVVRNETPFEQVWERFGRSYDPEAGAGGRIGWVTADGRREQRGSRPVPKDAMAQAWAAKKFPHVIMPVAADDGVWLLRVLGRRSERAPVFEEVRERVFDDLLDASLEERTAALLKSLKKQARVTYGGGE
jgi:hypothetical protein